MFALLVRKNVILMGLEGFCSVAATSEASRLNSKMYDVTVKRNILRVRDGDFEHYRDFLILGFQLGIYITPPCSHTYHSCMDKFTLP